MKLTLKKKRSKTDWIKLDDGQKLLIDYPTLEQSQGLETILMDDTLDDKRKMLEYQRLFLRYTIKDWKGLPEKCELVNNELRKDLWEDLVRSFTQTINLFTLINSELEWTVNDSKKSDM